MLSRALATSRLRNIGLITSIYVCSSYYFRSIQPKRTNAYCATDTSSVPHRGALIVFEGADRCGKTTQAKLLVERLKKKNIPAVFMRFPDRTTSIGRMIDSYLQNVTDLDDHAIHLLFAANRWEKASAIKHALLNGTTVIVDRYSYSGVAFSSAKGPHMDPEWCADSDRGLPQPDAVLYMTLPPKFAQKRGGFGSERYETVELQSAVTKQFAKLFDSSYWYTFDGSKPINECGEDIMKCVLEVINISSDKPLQPLWMKSNVDKIQ